MRFGPASNHYEVVGTELSNGVGGGRSELMLHMRDGRRKVVGRNRSTVLPLLGTSSELYDQEGGQNAPTYLINLCKASDLVILLLDSSQTFLSGLTSFTSHRLALVKTSSLSPDSICTLLCILQRW
ncbi:hypothetical protein QX201_008812 [Fusarium graminearum]